MFYYLNMFFVGSFIGYIIETCNKLFFHHSMNNGILHGPWIPLYGFGSILTIIIMRFIFNRTKFTRKVKILLVFISTVFFATILEWSGGILIEKFLHKTFWDYTKMKFNIGKYVSLEMSLLWGFAALSYIYFMKPIEEIFIKKIPKWLTILVSVLFLLDCFYTWILF